MVELPATTSFMMANSTKACNQRERCGCCRAAGRDTKLSYIMGHIMGTATKRSKNEGTFTTLKALVPRKHLFIFKRAPGLGGNRTARYHIIRPMFSVPHHARLFHSGDCISIPSGPQGQFASKRVLKSMSHAHDARHHGRPYHSPLFSGSTSTTVPTLVAALLYDRQ